MKIAFIYNGGWLSFLTKLFTGSHCYHVGFTDGMRFWDMHLIRRRRIWPCYPAERVILADCPVVVTAKYLNRKLDTDESTYGVLDYLLFVLRPVFHFFGKSTRNTGGLICSALVANDLIKNGWSMRFSEVPSPADLELVILGKKDVRPC